MGDAPLQGVTVVRSEGLRGSERIVDLKSGCADGLMLLSTTADYVARSATGAAAGAAPDADAPAAAKRMRMSPEASPTLTPRQP